MSDQIFPFCGSIHCLRLGGLYASSTQGLRKDVAPGITRCPDCGSTIIWKTYRFKNRVTESAKKKTIVRQVDAWK